jgi:arylsulfatase A-like enzyme
MRKGALVVTVLLAAATVAALAWHAKQLQFFCDDSYITFRYSQNFADGHGLVYNVGERVEGYTNFLWTVLLGLGLKLGASAEPFSLWLGIAGLVGTLALTVLLARRLLGSTAFALVPAFLLVCQGPMILWSVSGLESSLFTAMIVAALLAYERSASWKGLLLAGALYAASAMVRPDGVVFGAAAGLHLVLAGLIARPRKLGETTRRGLALAAGFALLFVPFVAWRRSYYGDWLPNTFYVKAGGLSNMQLGVNYLELWFRQYPWMGALTIAGVVATLALPRWRAPRASFAHLALALGLFCGYLAWAGGDYMALFRFVVPMLPIAAIPAAALLQTLFEASLRARVPAPVAATAGLAVVGALGWRLWQPTLRELDPGSPEISKAISPLWRMKRNSAQWAALGRAVKETAPPTWTIATTAAGALPYFAGMRTIDQSGLCDRHTAKVDSDPWLLDRPGHMKQATRAHVAELHPELVFWHPQLEPAGTSKPFPTPPTDDYELRAMAVPELEEEGLCAYLWVRKNVAGTQAARGFVPPKESAKLAKPRDADSDKPERGETRYEKRRDRHAEEVEAALAELDAEPPPAPPTVDPPLPPPYTGPIFRTERVHACDPAADEARFSADDVSRPLWVADGAAEVELAGEGGGYLELEVASVPLVDPDDPTKKKLLRLAGALAPKSATVAFTPEGGARVELPCRIETLPFASDHCWRTLHVDLAGVPAGKGRLEVKVDGAPVGKGSGWLATVPRICRRKDDDARPNVLVITIDTLRADYLGCYGHDRPTSPAIDRLASGAVLFERNVSQASWTLPSYSSFFSSLYGESHGVVLRESVFEGRFVTFLEVLARAGWATGAVVSGTFTDASWGLDQGFDSYDDLGMVVDETQGLVRAREGASPMAPEAMKAAAHRRITAPEVANKAIAWLDAHRDRRFALFVHFFDPHEDYLKHPGVSGRFPKRVAPSGFPNTTDPKPEVTAAMRALYEGEIAYTDQHVARLLARLEQLGLDEKTIVVLFSDHGEAFKEHVLVPETDATREEGEKDSRNRGHGSSLFNEQVHVPLIVRAPGFTPAHVKACTGNVDIGPTVLELCGVSAVDWKPQGASLVALLRDPAAEREERVLSSMFRMVNPPGAGESARVQIAWRVDFEDLAAIQYESIGNKRGMSLLFDWTKDRWQEFAHNLVDTMRERFDQVHHYYETRRTELRELLKPTQSLDTDSDVEERLRQLGYPGQKPGKDGGK